MLLHEVAPRFVMVGDPGQIPPVVSIDTARWATAEVPPHRPAPELILAGRGQDLSSSLALPASRRLPHDSAEAVNTFYDFRFESWAGPGDRALRSKAKRRRRDRQGHRSVAGRLDGRDHLADPARRARRSKRIARSPSSRRPSRHESPSAGGSSRSTTGRGSSSPPTSAWRQPTGR